MLGLADVWNVVIAIAVGLLVVWIALVVVLLGLRPTDSPPREALRILPDTVRLLRRVAADRTVPRGVRIRVYALLGYLASPIDLIPDFLPMVGYADDAIIVAVTLRSVVHRAGTDVLVRHWTGTEAGLATLSRAAGLPAPGNELGQPLRGTSDDLADGPSPPSPA